MKTFATPRQTVLAVWIISGTVSAAAPVPKPEITSPEDAGVVLTVLTDEKHTIPIEPGDEVGFEPSTLGTAWELGTRNAIFFTRGEGRGAVVVWHTDGGVDRIPVNSTATPTTGEHRTTVFLGTPTIIHLHDVVRWDVGDASILTVTRDGLAFSLKGLRVGSTSFRAWDGEGRMGVWNVAVLDSENQPIRIVVGMSKLVQMPDMLRADVDGDAATATLIGPRNLQLTARKEGAATVTIALKDGSTKRRTVIVGPLPTQGPVREIALPEDGGRIDVRVGETVSIQVPALKRFEQRGDVSPVDVRGTTLMIRPERRGDTTFTVETHTSSASRKFTIEAR